MEITLFLCAEPVDLKHKDRDKVKNVMTLPLRSNMIRKARERGDSWGSTVLARLESCADLVAEEAIYHALCMTNFCLVQKETKKKGRPFRPRHGDCIRLNYAVGWKRKVTVNCIHLKNSVRKWKS